MSYTSSPNGLFTYTITGVSNNTELAVIQSAFDKWDSICLIDTSRWGSSYTINVTYSVADLATGILGGASLQTYNISQGTTYGNIMPYQGTIQLNTDYTASMLTDIRTGGKTQYYYVVLHELGHILGIGPFWSAASPFFAPITSYTDANDSTTKYYYTGTNAFNQYKSYLYGDALELIVGLPIEDNGGSGTADVHPEEGLENEVSSDTRYINGIFHPGLNDELMTGWMEGNPTDTPISRVTLGFLADMGYIINYNDAESFSIIYTSMSFSTNPELFHQQDFAYFNNANKFKESYMKTFFDVSGDIRLDSNYTAIFNAFGDAFGDASANEIQNILKTNTLDASNIIHDLSVNKGLVVQNDVSLNKKMFIAGDLSVNGTLHFPDNSLSESNFTGSFSQSTSTNEYFHNNSNITTALDLSGLELYVAGDVRALDKDFQVEGNTYANNFINDDLNNVIMEDDSLINRLDLSNNAFSVSKIYYDSSYSNIASDFSYNAVPFISDNGKNICYPVYDNSGTTNYNTLYSNNHGTSFIDMATRLGGTAGSTNTKGLQNLYLTENQKYIYGYHNSEGIKRSDNYGYSFTDISMVNVPDSDLSYCVGLAGRNSAFDTTHSNLIASSASGKHVYLGGFKPYDNNEPNNVTRPTYYWDFRQASTTSITDSISGLTATYNGSMSSTVSDGASFDGSNDYISFAPYIDGTSGFSVEWYFNQTSSSGELSGLFDLAYDTTWNQSTQDNIMVFSTQGYASKLWPVITESTSHGYFSNRHNINNSTWYHCVLTSNNSGTARLYVNGAQVLLQTGMTQSIVSGTRPSSVIGGASKIAATGSGQFNNEGRFNGKVGYFRIYNNKELSSSDVTTLYNNRSIIGLYNAVDYGHFLIKSSDFGQTMNFDLSASAINMMTHKNSDLSFNSMIGSRHVSCSADGKYVICSVHGLTKIDDINTLSVTDASANWYPVLSRDYGNNWDLLTSKTFKEYHLLENTDASFNTSNSLSHCVGTAVSKTGKYVACAFNSAASIPKPIMFYLSSDYGKTFDLKANLELDTYDISYNGVVNPTYNWDFRQASTTSITDSIGGLTATYNGSMSSTVSDGATFDGNNDYISLTNFQLGSTFTIESYHKFASGVTAYGTVFSFGDNINGYSNWLSLDINSNGPTYRYAQKNGTSAAGSVGVGNIVFGEYQHIVITVTPTTIKFYENGSLINTTTSGVSAIVDKTRSYHRLGMNIGNNTEYFESNIKYFRVWNGTELSSSDVTTLYNNLSTSITETVNDNLSNGLQISLSSNAETISLVSTKSASKVYSSSDYGTSWNTKSIALSNDLKEHYSQISSNSQYLVRNINIKSSSDGNYYHSKLCKQITPYEKTYYTHMVKDFSNISNGNSSADSSITYSGGILTASDYRLKSNVQQLQDETVDNLQPVKFTFKNSQQETFGLIAHELESIYPFLVDGEKDGTHYQTVNYNGLLGVLVHELQLIRKGLEEYE